MDYSELVKALRETATFTKFDDLLSKREQKLESLAFDAAAAIEALETEIRESMQKCAECGDANMPKRGEWKPFDLTYGRSIYSCSVCEQATEVPMCMEKPMYAYCPNCGAKMEVQDGSSR